MSTAVQLKGDSLRRQLEKSARYAAEHDLVLDEDFELHDIGLSAFDGSNVQRGNLGRFLAAVRAGQISSGSYLLVESFDRLSRDDVMSALTIFLELLNAGIKVVTLTDGRTYEQGKTDVPEIMMSLFIMSRAHEESVQKSDRLSASWKAKRARVGTQKLTAKCPGWLRLNADRTGFNLIPERVAIVRRIYTESLSGMGGDVIARRFNQEKVPAFGRATGWHKSYVQKVLCNPAVIGTYHLHSMVDGKRVPTGDQIPDYFPAVIDEATFYAAKGSREARRMNGGGRKGNSYANLFTRLAKCGTCGSTMTFRNRGERGGASLVCDFARRGLGCQATSGWTYRQFEASFLAFVTELDLMQFDSAAAVYDGQQHEQQVLVLDGKLVELRRKRDRIMDLLIDAEVPETTLKAKFKDVEATIEILEGKREAHKQALEQQHATSLESAVSQATLRPLICRLQSGTEGDVYRLRSAIAARLKAIVAEIVVFPNGKPRASERAVELRGRLAEMGYASQRIDHQFAREAVIEQRCFVVMFRGGGHRFVWPDARDPMRLISAACPIIGFSGAVGENEIR